MAQAQGKADNKSFYYHSNIYEDKIGFLQRRLDNTYKELEEVGNNNTHLEFKRYKEKYNSDIKDT